jgi:hypothetical protein
MKHSSILSKCSSLHFPLGGAWLQFGRDSLPRLNLQSGGAKTDLSVYENSSLTAYASSQTASKFNISSSEYDTLQYERELDQMSADTGLLLADCSLSRNAQSIVFERQFIRLGVRKQENALGQSRTVAALIPKQSCLSPLIISSISKKYVLQENGEIAYLPVAAARLLFTLAVMNSSIFGWLTCVDTSCPGLFYAHGVKPPMPQPSTEELGADPVLHEIVFNSLYLTLADNWSAFEGLAAQFRVHPREVPTTEVAKEQLRLRNEYLVSNLYKLTQDEALEVRASLGV